MTPDPAAFRRPPGPAAPVRLGIDPDTLATLTRLSAEFGNTVAMTQPNGRLAYFINEPGDVRRILVRQHARYRKGPGFERVKMLLGNGLIVSDGDTWRRSRRMIQPAFSRQNIHGLMQVMVACAERVATRWAAAAGRGERINVTAETSEFALELILISIFGADYERTLVAGGDNPFAFLSRDSTRDLGVVLKVRHLRELLLGIIASRRRGGQADSFDFLSMYLDARDRNGVAFTDEELLDELMTLIVAGFETSANTLNWAWYLIAGLPGVEANLLDEIERLMPDVGAVTAENAAAMTRTQQVLEETLRLYPPVWLFTRRAEEDDALEDYDVPAGTDLYLSPFILHRTEAFWSDPARFAPERFADLGKDRPYFPFSLGPRRCLGEYFSFVEMKVHLAMLLPRFRLARCTDAEPGLELGINLRAADDIFLTPALRA
ncbi:MAG: cytochrome P450 [Woeseiaceae bacterium]|nr:cytochrome P450 [Woeseiaceae bacterium]